MKKFIAVIEKITHEVVCLEANDPSDLFLWESLEAFDKLPHKTINKLRNIDQTHNGYWRFANIHAESEVIKGSLKREPKLPEIHPLYEFLLIDPKHLGERSL